MFKFIICSFVSHQKTEAPFTDHSFKSFQFSRKTKPNYITCVYFPIRKMPTHELTDQHCTKTIVRNKRTPPDMCMQVFTRLYYYYIIISQNT